MNDLKVNLENLTQDERKQLTALIEKSQNPETIKCTGGAWYIDKNLKVRRGNTASLLIPLSAQYETNVDAQLKNEAFTELRIINNIIRQENKRTGFVADYTNRARVKHSFCFAHDCTQFYIDAHYATERLGSESCNFESAEKIKDWLDRGMIEGIVRGKIK
jgi:hypothetical protein